MLEKLKLNPELEQRVLTGRKAICQRFKDLRKDRGLSVRQAGEAMAIQYQTISKIENGDWSVSIDYLLVLADFYQVKIIVM